MKTGTFQRGGLSFLVLALFGLLGALWSFGKSLTFDFRFFGHPGIAAYESRFHEMRDDLPPRGTVGYLSHIPPEKLFADPRGTAYFYVAQYALAPLVVANDPGREIVIGNFYSPPVLPPGNSGEWSVEQSYGDGLYLLRNGRSQ